MNDYFIHESTRAGSGNCDGLIDTLIFLGWIATVFLMPGLALILMIGVACSN